MFVGIYATSNGEDPLKKKQQQPPPEPFRVLIEHELAQIRKNTLERLIESKSLDFLWNFCFY